MQKSCYMNCLIRSSHPGVFLGKMYSQNMHQNYRKTSMQKKLALQTNPLIETQSLLVVLLSINRNSHQRCSLKNGVLGNVAKFTGKHLRQSIFLNKIAGLRAKWLSVRLRTKWFWVRVQLQ